MRQQPGAYDVVISLAGHDSGKLYMVVGRSDARLFLSDGKNHRLSNPKTKNPKHVRTVAGVSRAPATDKGIRQTLAQAAHGAEVKGGELLGKG